VSSNPNAKSPPAVAGQPFTPFTSENEPRQVEIGLASQLHRGTTAVSRDMRQMTPIVFNKCFGWLHHSGGNLGSDVAVLMCSGLNLDALDAHYSLRLLADEMAAAGYLALRFDYPGTGDSYDVADPDEDPEGHWAAWQESVDEAADWLRSTLGVRRFVFCGVRFGALLATLAAGRQSDAVGLLLLAPVFRGHSYMRQMLIEAQLQNDAVAAVGAPLDFQGLYLSPRSISAISQVDLRQVELSAGLEVGIFPQSASKLVTECEEAWVKRGAHVKCGSFDGMQPMLDHNIQGEGQPSNFSGVLEWLVRSIRAQPIQLQASLQATSSLAIGHWVETPLRFGEDGSLFGVFCRPCGAVGTSAVLITNSGVNPHYGFARLSVELARRLAAAGVASLRFDFAGLGDSLGRPGKEHVVSGIFESDRRPDISAAIDALERLGLKRFAIGGLCSGAYHALQGALHDERLRALFLINMPIFVWREGDTIEFVSHKKAPTAILVKLVDRKVLKQLLQGGIDIRVVAQSQLERFRERLSQTVRPIAKALGRATSDDQADVAVAMLSQRRVKTLFIYSPEDVGLDVFELSFGRGGRKLPPGAGATVKVVPALDHNLSTRNMRRTAFDIMINWISEVNRCGPGGGDDRSGAGESPSSFA
jgi:pimeloyl-ACP methyl ester carboxylesterase